MDGITFGYLSSLQWMYLRVLCDGGGRRLDSAASLAHARACRACVYALAEIAAGRPVAVQRVTVPATSPAGTVTMTAVLPAVTP